MKRYTYLYIIMAAACSVMSCSEDSETMQTTLRRPIQVSLSDVEAQPQTRFYEPVNNLDIFKTPNGYNLLLAIEYQENGEKVRETSEIIWNSQTSKFEMSTALFWPGNPFEKVSFALISNMGGLDGFDMEAENFGEIWIPIGDKVIDDEFFDYVTAKAELSESEVTNGTVNFSLSHIMSGISVSLLGVDGYAYKVYDVSLERSALIDSYNVVEQTWIDADDDENSSPNMFKFHEEEMSYDNSIALRNDFLYEIEGEMLVPPGTYTLKVSYASAAMDAPSGPLRDAAEERNVTITLSAGERKEVTATLPPL